MSFATSGIRLLRGLNVKRGELDWSAPITQYWPALTGKTKQYELRDGDLVIAMDGALVGRSFATISNSDLPALLVQRVARIRSKSVDQQLLHAWIASDGFVRHVDLVKTHTAIPHISSRDIRAFSLSVPANRGEQRAIGEASNDVDALLAGLDQLIAKKRDLKKAAMQQLLTGRTRLVGFDGAWVKKLLGESGSIYGGLAGKVKKDFGTGSDQYVTFVNVIKNVAIDCALFESVRIDSTESQNLVKAGDLLFNGSSETPEEVAMCSLMTDEVPRLYLNSFCFGFRLRDGADIDGLFLAYYLRSREGRELMKSLAQGSTRYNLSKTALLDSFVPLPALLEQTAIAAVFADMDVDLMALEARRTKTLALKQAMMQELLTGRIRLI